MKTITSFVRWLFIFQVIMSFGAFGVSAWAQVDPTKALIGTWEGTVGVSIGERERTIIIQSVKPNAEGGWVARGRYGITGQKLGGQTYDVSVKDNEINVDFITAGGGKIPVHLKLVGDNKLEGTFTIPDISAPGGEIA